MSKSETVVTRHTYDGAELMYEGCDLTPPRRKDVQWELVDATTRINDDGSVTVAAVWRVAGRIVNISHQSVSGPGATGVKL